MNNPFLGGILGRIGANEGQKIIDEHIHQSPDRESLFHRLHTTICCLLDEIKFIADHFRSADEPPIDVILTLKTTSRVHLPSRNKRYNMIFVPNGSTQILANLPGVGSITFTPAAGWTELDFADGTEMQLATGSDQNVIYRCTNVSMGANVL